MSLWFEPSSVYLWLEPPYVCLYGLNPLIYVSMVWTPNVCLYGLNHLMYVSGWNPRNTCLFGLNHLMFISGLNPLMYVSMAWISVIYVSMVWTPNVCLYGLNHLIYEHQGQWNIGNGKEIVASLVTDGLCQVVERKTIPKKGKMAVDSVLHYMYWFYASVGSLSSWRCFCVLRVITSVCRHRAPPACWTVQREAVRVY